jgi:hypothetical protein
LALRGEGVSFSRPVLRLRSSFIVLVVASSLGSVGRFWRRISPLTNSDVYTTDTWLSGCVSTVIGTVDTWPIVSFFVVSGADCVPDWVSLRHQKDVLKRLVLLH